MGFFQFAFILRYNGPQIDIHVPRLRAMMKRFKNGMTHEDSAFCMPADEISDHNQCYYIRRMNRSA